MKLTNLIVVFTVFAMILGVGSNALAGPSADATVTGVSATIISNGSDLKDGRGFAIPGELLFPGTPGFFGEDTPGHEFIPLSKLTMFTTVWDVQAAKNMLKGYTGSKDVQVRAMIASDDTLPTDKIYVSILAPGADAFDQVAFATVAATSKKSISADVFAKTLVEASELGSNYVMFLAEGFNKTIASWGVGAGISHTNADLKGGGNGSAGSSVVGAGITYGEARYQKRPWLQATFLVVPELAEAPLPVVETPEEVVEEVAPEADDTEQKYLLDYIKELFSANDTPAAEPVQLAQTSDRINPVD